jgi:hypothetical protein
MSHAYDVKCVAVYTADNPSYNAISFSAKCSRWELTMDIERIIDDIEQLQEMFEAPDIRPLSPSDISAANRRHDETLAHSPWFRLWQRYGVCCRLEAPALRLDGSNG